MKTALRLAALGVLAASHVSAHYIFEVLSIGSTKYPVYQYIRENTNYNSPVTDLTSNDLRCNVGANGSSTQTITVQAGAQFSFTTDTAVYHDGPISLYMSKAPGAASDYDGSGPWFKIYDWGPTFTSSGATWPLYQTYTFNIPSCLPNGDYLLRIQSLAIHNPWPAGIPQFYTSCAQITITGGGNASPSPTALIPGFIKDTDPGYTVNIYTNFNNYTVPGPAVWSCGSSGGGGGGGSSSTTLSTSTRPATSSTTTTSKAPTTTTTTTKPTTTTTTTTKPTTTTTTSAAPTTTTASGGSSGCSIAKYGQCGGTGWTGCTVCASGSTCQASNSYYSQCL